MGGFPLLIALILRIIATVIIVHIMTEYKEKLKKSTEYEELKESREKTLVNELDDYLKRMRMLAVIKFAKKCEKLATKDGEVD